MFGSSILEVAISLTFIYLLLSLICSALQESLEGKLKIRASHLEQGLRELLNDPKGTGLVKDIYNHPLLFGLFRGSYDPNKVRAQFTTNLPNYIPAANFAVALMDTIVRGPVSGAATPVSAGELSTDTLSAAVANSTSLNASVQRVLLLALDAAHGDLAKVQSYIEAWFNSSMERVSGWYKRRTQFFLLGIGLAVTVLLNVNTMRLATELYHNTTLRTAVTAQAEGVAKGAIPPAAEVNSLLGSLQGLNLPIGWQGYENRPWTEAFWITTAWENLIGWLLTAFAISFGAPFWFELLNRFISIRSTIKIPAATSGTINDGPNQPSDGLRMGTSPAPTGPALPLHGVVPPQDAVTFRPHEWAKGNDPQGGVL